MRIYRKTIIEYLKNHGGKEVSTYEMIKDCYGEDNIPDIRDFEWMKIDEKVHKIAKENGYVLDSSKYDDMVIGLPFHIGFVIRKEHGNKYDMPFMNMGEETVREVINQNSLREEAFMRRAVVRNVYEKPEDDLIYRNDSYGWRSLVRNTTSVYDRDKNNVVFSTFGAKGDGIRTYTVETNVIHKIRESIKNSDVTAIKSFEGVDIVVNDGVNNSFYFNSGENDIFIECGNFYVLYKDCDKNSNARKVMRLVNRIEALLIKYTDEKK